MSEIVYKIVPRAAWEAACVEGSYRGSADDARDGFIHLSLAEQLEGTLERHFAGQRDLLLVSFDADALVPGLRFEPSRGGTLFPHYYGVLPTSRAVSVAPIG